MTPLWWTVPVKLPVFDCPKAVMANKQMNNNTTQNLFMLAPQVSVFAGSLLRLITRFSEAAMIRDNEKAFSFCRDEKVQPSCLFANRNERRIIDCVGVWRRRHRAGPYLDESGYRAHVRCLKWIAVTVKVSRSLD